jgi:hypothetical protein
MRKSKIHHVDHDVFAAYLSQLLDLVLEARILCEGDGASKLGIVVGFDGLRRRCLFRGSNRFPTVNDRSLSRLPGTGVRDEDKVSVL